MDRQHRPALDGLRGFASLWVVIGHLGQNIPSIGYLNNGVAVDLFMMVSGYLMFTLHADDGWRAPGRFAAKRVFRLIPLYWLVLGIGFVITPWFKLVTNIAWHGAQAWPIDGSVGNLLLHMALLHGFSPLTAQSTPLPDWSLALEAQFYVAFPAIAWLVARSGISRAIFLLLAIQACLLTLFHGYFYGFHGFPTPLPLKLHIFVAGILVAYGCRDPKRAAIAFAAALLLMAVPVQFSAKRVILAREMCALLLIASVTLRAPGPAKLVQVLFASRIGEQAGRLSYGVYLIHLPIVYGVIAALSPLPMTDLFRFIVAMGVTLPTTYLLAWIAYETVERPGIALGRMALARRPVAIAAPAAPIAETINPIA